MIEHSWDCNYTSTLSPDIRHFQNFVVFFLGGGEDALRPPIRGQKIYLLAAYLYFGPNRSPFFIPTGLTALWLGISVDCEPEVCHISIKGHDLL